MSRGAKTSRDTVDGPKPGMLVSSLTCLKNVGYFLFQPSKFPLSSQGSQGSLCFGVANSSAVQSIRWA